MPQYGRLNELLVKNLLFFQKSINYVVDIIAFKPIFVINQEGHNYIVQATFSTCHSLVVVDLLYNMVKSPCRSLSYAKLYARCQEKFKKLNPRTAVKRKLFLYRAKKGHKTINNLKKTPNKQLIQALRVLIEIFDCNIGYLCSLFLKDRNKIRPFKVYTIRPFEFFSLMVLAFCDFGLSCRAPSVCHSLVF